MMKKFFLGGFLTILSMFVSCDKEYPSRGSMKIHVDEVAATSVTVSFAAETPSNITGYIVGAVASVGDPMASDDSDEVFGKMAEAKPGRSDYKITIDGLKPETKYNVRAIILPRLGGLATWGDMESFTTSAPVFGKAVDLGLSVKWSDINVGATSPEEYGDYFAWGETAPKSHYNWKTYKYVNGDFFNLTKYCTSPSYGTVDDKTVLEKSDDAASVNWGGKWRMPTHEEWAELRNDSNCSWTWMSINGITGYKVQSRKPGYTENWIFLPAAGYRYDGSLSNDGSYGDYWSSSFNASNPSRAYYLGFGSGSVDWLNFNRCSGYSVRPVSEPMSSCYSYCHQEG